MPTSTTSNRPRKRVLFLATAVGGAGGIQAYGAGFIEALRAASADVRVVSRAEAGSRLAMIARSIFAGITGRPDLVVCGHAALSPLGLLLSLTGAPFTVCIYGMEIWGTLTGLQAFALRRARAIVTISRYTEMRLRERLGAASLPSVTLIPPSVDEARFTLAPRWSEENTVLTVGRLAAGERYKGYDTIIEALPEVVRAVPDAHYVIVGDGDDRGRIERLAAESGMSGRVRIETRVTPEALPGRYHAARVFAMPSTGEGFGIVFLEAIASGVPVVAGNADASCEALLDGRLGTLVDPRDPRAVAQAIIAALRGELPPALADRASLRRAMLSVYGKDMFGERVRAWLAAQ